MSEPPTWCVALAKGSIPPPAVPAVLEVALNLERWYPSQDRWLRLRTDDWTFDGASGARAAHVAVVGDRPSDQTYDGARDLVAVTGSRTLRPLLDLWMWSMFFPKFRLSSWRRAAAVRAPGPPEVLD